MTDWFYSINGGEPDGPHDAEDIRSLLLVGTLDKTALVWREGMPQWSPVRSEPEFSDLFPTVTPPPLPTRSVPPAVPLQAPPFQPRQETAVVPHIVEAVRLDPEVQDSTEEEFSVAPPSNEPTYSGTVGLAGPWTRYFARTFDMSLIGTVIATGITLALPSISIPLSLQWYMADSRAVFFLMLPLIMIINGLIISIFGNSLGKALFGIKALPVSGAPKFSVGDTVVRELTVWGKGLCLGIPILCLFTMVPAFRKVRDKLPTDYDLGRATVRSFSNNTFRRVVGMLVTIALLCGIYALNAVEKLDQQRLQTTARWTNPVTSRVATIPAGWAHEVTAGPDGARLDAFTNVNTGVVAFIAVETADITLEQYKMGLQTALAATTPLGSWTPAGLSIPMSKASGQSIADKWPTTVYVTQVGSNSFWRVVYIDTGKATAQEVGVPEMTMALMGTVR
ncbi:RDD family protein [Devosia sp. MC1541]|uniref:RDD family protein n=1 Tax=Devosia sp. MC1541 TaxID=2725264 RepID=UPI001AED2439|nr:RDD family protein [Devosia sp. MC1541]